MRLKYCALFSLLLMEHVLKRRMPCVSTEVSILKHGDPAQRDNIDKDFSRTDIPVCPVFGGLFINKK